MGKTSQFGKTLQHSMDYTMRKPLKRICANLGGYGRWSYQSLNL